MKNMFRLISIVVLLASAPSFASETISRGGLGFLFPDHNSFENAGQFALDRGTAAEVDYSMQNSNGVNNQTLTPSVVYGSGTFGFGVQVERAGTDLMNPSNKTDSVGAGIGFGLLKDRLTIGFTGLRSIDVNQTNDGTVGAQITWNGDKRMGFTAGIGAGTTINQANGNTETGTAALGWGFNQMTRVEVDVKFNNLQSNMSDYDIGGFLTMEGKMLYASAGFNYLMLNKESELIARVGLTFGKFDISAYVDDALNGNGVQFVSGYEDTLNSGVGLKFGGTARLMF